MPLLEGRVQETAWFLCSHFIWESTAHHKVHQSVSKYCSAVHLFFQLLSWGSVPGYIFQLIYNKPDFFFSRVTSSSRSRLVIVCTLVYRIFYYLTRHAVSPNSLFFTPTRPAEVEGSQSTQAGRRKPGQIGTPGERCYSKYKEVPNLGVPKTGFVKCDETHQAQQMPYVT